MLNLLGVLGVSDVVNVVNVLTVLIMPKDANEFSCNNNMSIAFSKGLSAKVLVYRGFF